MASTPRMRKKSSVRVEVEAALTSRVRTRPARRASMAGVLGDRPLTIYLSPKTAPCRTAWLIILHNNIPHDMVNVDEGGREVHRLLEVISPFGTLPALKDGSNQVFGIPACLQYIDEVYCSGEGFGQGVKQKSRCEAIINWASTTLYRDVVVNLVEQQLALEEKNSEDTDLSMALVSHAKVKVQEHLDTLEEQYLSSNNFLLGNEPLVADAHVAMTLSMLDMVNLSLGRHQKVTDWLKRVRHYYGESWDTVCQSHTIRLLQRGSRRASVVA